VLFDGRRREVVDDREQEVGIDVLNVQGGVGAQNFLGRSSNPHILKSPDRSSDP
jgi:hypothetical protein